MRRPDARLIVAHGPRLLLAVLTGGVCTGDDGEDVLERSPAEPAARLASPAPALCSALIVRLISARHRLGRKLKEKMEDFLG